MLADQLDYIGVDPHRDSHSLAVVQVVSGVVVFEATIAAGVRWPELFSEALCYGSAGSQAGSLS